MEKITEENIKQTVDKVKQTVPDINSVELELVLKQMYQENKSLREAIHLSDEFIETAYSTAYNMYQAGQFEEALKQFKLLNFLDGKQARFINGIAKCHEQLKRYKEAIAHYLVLTQKDPDNTNHFWNMYICYDKLGDKKGALMAISGYYYLTEGTLELEEDTKKAEDIIAKLVQGIADDIEAQSVKTKKG